MVYGGINTCFTQHARRLSTCTQRLIDASCEDIDALRSMGISFVALAITTVAARSTSRLGVPSTTENELIVYIQTATLKDLAVNEVYKCDICISQKWQA